MTGAGLSIASVDEKRRDAYYRRSHGAMLSLFYEWGNRAAWITAAIIAVLFFCAVIYAFPNARQVAMQQRDATERENRAFCEKYGRLFGTREHTLCAEDLDDIRANERQRTLDNLGIF